MVYPLLKLTLGNFVRAFMKEIEGKENIPKDKAFIIACNHASFFDDAAVPSVVIPVIDKKIHFYISHNYFKKFFLGIFLEKVAEGIPIAAKKSDDSNKINEGGFKQALEYLKKNEPVGIFPEGTRSLEGKLQKGKTGIARLALGAKVPVLPIGIEGSYRILPKGCFFPKFKRCRVKIGKLMYFNKYYNKKINKQLLTRITREIMKEIARLSNQEYKF